MKQFILFGLILALVLLLLLTACAPSGEPIPEEEALAACRGVLEDLQDHDSYHLRIGYEDTGAVTEQYQLGEDGLYIFYNPDSEYITTQAFLSRKGLNFNTELADPFCSLEDMQWQQVRTGPDGFHLFVPWLYTYRWDEEDMLLESAVSDRKGKTVLLHFVKPYAYPTYNPPSAQEYEVEFRFDRDWTFREAVLRGFFHYGEAADAEYDQYRQDVMSIVTTDENQIAAVLDREYDRAVEQNKE